MGVNMVGYCISDDEACQEAARQEIIRRYFKALVTERTDELDSTLSGRVAVVMNKAGVAVDDRAVLAPARRVAEKAGSQVLPLSLPTAPWSPEKPPACWVVRRQCC